MPTLQIADNAEYTYSYDNIEATEMYMNSTESYKIVVTEKLLNQLFFKRPQKKNPFFLVISKKPNIFVSLIFIVIHGCCFAYLFVYTFSFIRLS